MTLVFLLTRMLMPASRAIQSVVVPAKAGAQCLLSAYVVARELMPCHARRPREGGAHVFVRSAPRYLRRTVVPRPGFVSSIRSIFHARFHFLICFSRVIADSRGIVVLVPDQLLDSMLLREPIDHRLLVLPYSLDQIRCHTDIQRAVRACSRECRRRSFVHANSQTLGPRLRGDDGISLGPSRATTGSRRTFAGTTGSTPPSRE